MAAVRVLVWDEGGAPRSVYPDGLGAAVAAGLGGAADGIQAQVTGPADPDQGASPAALAETDVLVWWSHHATAARFTDRAARRVALAVTDRGMGLVVLHSGYLGKPFRFLLGADAGIAGGGDEGGPEEIRVVDPSHPVAAGIADFRLPEEEWYAEPFRVEEPDAVVFESRFPPREGAFRSGMTWTRGAGRIFYFRPGHEAYPVYGHPSVRSVIANAVRWCARRT